MAFKVNGSKNIPLTRGLQAKSTSGGCNLHTKVCKCNSSIKNLTFDQITPGFFSVLPKNDTAHFDYMFDLIGGNLFDLKRVKARLGNF